MSNQIVIDGIDFTDSALAGIDRIDLEYGIFDNTYGFGASSEIKLGKAGFEYIQNKFFQGCTDIKNTCEVGYFKECCDLSLDLNIDFQDVEICPYDCQADITLSKISPYKECYDYLCKTLIGQDGYKDVATLHKVYYAINGGFVQRFLFIFLPIFTIILYIVSIILNIVIALCKAIEAFNSIPIVPNIPFVGECPPFLPLNSLACSLSEYVAGIGNYHAGIKLKEVFEYYTRRCGLEFKSGIFNDPVYSNMGILLSLNTEGQNGNDLEWIQENVPTKPIKQLLDDLGENVFNASWIIKDGCLYFDRKDIIDNLRNEIFSLGDIEDRLVKKPCISYITEDAAPAYLDFSYCSDALNSAGRSQSRKFSGNVEWNANRDKHVGDARVVQSSCFSAEHRFMFDTKWQRQSGAIQWDKVWDKFRCGDYLGALDALTGALTLLVVGGAGPLGVIATIIGGLIVCDVKRKCDLILSGDVTGCLPLLIFDPNSPLDDTTVLKRQVDEIDGFPIYEYNYPLSMVCQLSDDSFATQPLYDNFWAIEDPNLKGREVYQLTELEWVPTCEEIKRVHNELCGWYINTAWGKVNVDLIRFECSDEGNKAIVELGKIRCYK